MTFKKMLLVGILSTNNLWSSEPTVYYSYDKEATSPTTVFSIPLGQSKDTQLLGHKLAFTTGKFGKAVDVSYKINQKTPRSKSPSAIVNKYFLPGTRNYTISFWYRQSKPDAWGNRIWSAGSTSIHHPYGMQIYLQGPLQLTDQSGAPGCLEVALASPNEKPVKRIKMKTSSPSGLWDGVTWNHIALVRNGQSLSLWINGEIAAQKIIPTNYNISVNNQTDFREATFGPHVYLDSEMKSNISNASIDDAAIFHRALSNEDISFLWNKGIGNVANSLKYEPGSTLLTQDVSPTPPPSSTLISIGGLSLQLVN